MLVSRCQSLATTNTILLSHTTPPTARHTLHTIPVTPTAMSILVRHAGLPSVLLLVLVMVSILHSLPASAVSPSRPTCASSPPTPWFEDDFSTNPTTDESAFGWLQSDSSDPPSLRATHTGLVNLTGVFDHFQRGEHSRSSYINLTANEGPHSVGLTLPGAMGGASSGSLAGSTYGWSIELTFKASAWLHGGEAVYLFDAGGVGAACVDELALLYGTSSNGYMAQMCTSNGSTDPTYFAYDNEHTISSEWTHLVMVYNQLPSSPSLASHIIYIDADTADAQGTVAPYPAGVYRENVLLGASRLNAYASMMWSGLVDDVAIYDVALTAGQVKQLYAVRMGVNSSSISECVSDVQEAEQLRDSTEDAGIPVAWFEDDFSVDPRHGGAAYKWLQSDPADSPMQQQYHFGLVQLTGSGAVSYINLTHGSGPYSVGAALPGNVGGTSTGSLAGSTYGWSIELTFKQTVEELVLPSQILSLNIGVRREAPHSQLCDVEGVSFGPQPYSAPVYDVTYCNNQSQTMSVDDTTSHYAVVPLNWTHAVIVWQVLPSNPDRSVLLLYLNGTQPTTDRQHHVVGTVGQYLNSVHRQNALLGAHFSNFSAPMYWGGLIDQIAVYDVALTAAQVDELYAQRMEGVARNVSVPASSSSSSSTAAYVTSSVVSTSSSSSSSSLSSSTTAAPYDSSSSDSSAAPSSHTSSITSTSSISSSSSSSSSSANSSYTGESSSSASSIPAWLLVGAGAATLFVLLLVGAWCYCRSRSVQRGRRKMTAARKYQLNAPLVSGSDSFGARV